MLDRQRQRAAVVLQPPANSMQARAWQDAEGAQHVLVVAALRPHSFVQRGPHGRGFGDSAAAGGAYNRWRAQVRDLLAVELRRIQFPAFPRGQQLAAAFAGGARPAAPIQGARRADGEVDRRRVKGILDWDATDLQKAVEDVGNGLLWADDRDIRAVTGSVWYDTGADWWSIAAWGAGRTGLRIAPEAHWDESWLGPTVADWLHEIR